MTTNKEIDSRSITLEILIEVLENKKYSHVVLYQALSKYQYLEKVERAFISRVTEGTIEYLLQLDFIINEYSNVKVNKMKPVIRNLLRMSVYQLFYMDKIPDSAICNEAVKLAQKKKFHGLKGFVNGVLRTIARERDNVVFPNDAITYSTPQWLISMWEEQYGKEVTTGILKAFFKENKTVVRCNLHLASKETIIEGLKQQQVMVEESEISSGILYLSEYDYLEKLDVFQKGWIQVQDLSSSLVAEVADPKKGDYIIDVCAAPGGKSIHLADKLENTGMVEARDLTPAKVALIEENMARIGLTNMKAVVWDGLLDHEESREKADIVIADLPCSGLGVIGKKPDIKYNMTEDIIKQLVVLQRDLLSVVHRYVKPGGLLIYSTCTINSMENEETMEWFEQNFPFQLVDISNRLGGHLKEETMRKGYLQLLPGVHPCDGFFLCVFKRV